MKEYRSVSKRAFVGYRKSPPIQRSTWPIFGDACPPATLDRRTGGFPTCVEVEGRPQEESEPRSGRLITSGPNGLANRLRRHVRVVVFPESEYSPSVAPQKRVRITIAPDVRSNLVPPPTPISFWPCHVSRTAVPKAAINKNSDSCSHECHVRSTAGAREPPVNAESQTHCVNRRPYCKLTRRVSPRCNLHAAPDLE
jgi:hypothetical protein